VISIVIVAIAGAVDVSHVARAAESGIETDHIDADDDGGPRRVGVLMNGIASTLGFISIELDSAIAESVVLSVAVDRDIADDAGSYGEIAGAAFFPFRFAFRGPYIHPRVGLASNADPTSPSFVFPVVTVGYEWVCPVGCTVRVGGGGAYGIALAPDIDGAIRRRIGLHPAFDLSVGWIF
jgi:hypothetical protein